MVSGFCLAWFVLLVWKGQNAVHFCFLCFCLGSGYLRFSEKIAQKVTSSFHYRLVSGNALYGACSSCLCTSYLMISLFFRYGVCWDHFSCLLFFKLWPSKLALLFGNDWFLLGSPLPLPFSSFSSFFPLPFPLAACRRRRRLLLLVCFRRLDDAPSPPPPPPPKAILGYRPHKSFGPLGFWPCLFVPSSLLLRQKSSEQQDTPHRVRFFLFIVFFLFLCVKQRWPCVVFTYVTSLLLASDIGGASSAPFRYC